MDWAWRILELAAYGAAMGTAIGLTAGFVGGLALLIGPRLEEARLRRIARRRSRHLARDLARGLPQGGDAPLLTLRGQQGRGRS